jgi:N-acetylmuramoyl-L-alanine amidase
MTVRASEFIVDFTIEELDMLCYVVEREAHDGSFEHKQIITQIILNRVLSDDPIYPKTIKGVLHQKNQFNTISNYYDKTVPPTMETIQSVYEVLQGKNIDVTCNAIYFYSPKYASDEAAKWFETNCTYLFEFEGHRFFKNN